MTDATTRRERERGFERLLTFVDAIVAIAITLLVLPLVDAVGELDRGGSVRAFLGGHRDLIGAFFLSFFVIANLWQTQHRLLRDVLEDSASLDRLLVLWTLTIVFLPFPTALVAGHGGDQAITKVLYVGTMAISSALLGVMSLLVARDDRADRVDRVEGPARRPDVVHAFATSVTFVVALLVMVAVPATSYWPLLLLIVSDRAVSSMRRRTVAG
jgi:uncharacterized membrane protein